MNLQDKKTKHVVTQVQAKNITFLTYRHGLTMFPIATREQVVQEPVGQVAAY